MEVWQYGELEPLQAPVPRYTIPVEIWMGRSAT
jgi:hypothetical protein